MKTSHFLNIILAAALAIVAVLYAQKPQEAATEQSELATNAALENIFTRTSVRSYSSREVSRATVDTLLRAAMSAPTAVNKQPWQFVVIDDRAKLDSIASEFRNISMAAKAPMAVVVCGDMSRALDGEARDFWIQDCSAATENMLLAAHSLGLGAVWCGIYPAAERVAKLSELLGLPGHLVPLCVVPMGYPDGATGAKDKYDAARIHFNTVD